VVIPPDSPKGGQEIIDFVTNFGRQYGYDFEHEATYDRFCLVNDAVYIARRDSTWYPVGKQFQHPYVFKMLFSHDEVEFEDLCEVRSVNQGTIYLDTAGSGKVEDMVHVGRVGSFVPVRYGGGDLYRVKDGKLYALTGTKGYKWITREMAENREIVGELVVDLDYFQKLEKEARNAIEQFGSFIDFIV